MINIATILVAFLSFILGLIGNLFLQWWADRRKLSGIKGAIETHLKDIILKECVTLRSEFERVIVNIQNLNRHNITFKSCKTFDGEIYKANNPSDYYKIYGSESNKFDKLVSIYSVISYLKENIPAQVHQNYLREVNGNLDNINIINQGISLNQLFKESSFFDNLRSDYVTSCNYLINEIDTLTRLITELI